MSTRITLLFAMLLASVTMAFAQSNDSDPLVGTWIHNYSSGKGKIVIKISKYENNYILKKKTIWTNGKTEYDDITVTYSSPTQINYYSFEKDWFDSGEWGYYWCYYIFTFENGRANNLYVKLVRETRDFNDNALDRGTINKNESTIFDKEDPDW